MEEALFDAGLDFVSHPNLFGKPDFALPMGKIAIFCDGDFWHGYNFGRNPRHEVKDNREFWIEKIRRNRRRDRLVNRRLRRDGWIVLRFWEHEVKRNPFRCVKTVKEAVK
jgi:DNA mismatch endonuclease Vsr